MTRKVLLPREIDDKLGNLANLAEEVNGILFYQRQGDYCPVEDLFITGIGDRGHVRSDPDRVRIANVFFGENPSHKLIKFHTHSKGTIKDFGIHYAENFSPGDIEETKKQFRMDRDFMAMLVTPETRLLCGMDNPQLEIVDSYPGYHEKNRTTDRSLKNVIRDLGYDLSRFDGRM